MYELETCGVITYCTVPGADVLKGFRCKLVTGMSSLENMRRPPLAADPLAKDKIRLSLSKRVQAAARAPGA